MVLRDSDSKTRGQYLRRLAGEILTGAPAETYRNKSMERGSEMEAEARDAYAKKNFGEVERVGFIRRKLPSGRWCGASPDALIGKRRGALEIKTTLPELMIERLVNGAGMPPEHRAQIQGTMFVGDLDYVELILFYRGFPVTPKFNIGRDEVFIREIDHAVQVFDHELHKLVERVRAMGGSR